MTLVEILRRLVEFATWDNLRALSVSPLIRTTVAIPVVGYLILFNDRLATKGFLALSSEFAPGEWARLRLYLLYFGFCALAAGVTIFTVRCPRQIKQHGAIWEYLDREGRKIGSAQLDAIRKLVIVWRFKSAAEQVDIDAADAYEKIKPKLVHTVLQNASSLIPIAQTPMRDELLAAMFQKMKSYFDRAHGTDDMLTIYYAQMLRHTHPEWRVAVLFSYIVGGVALAIPTLELFMRVLKSFAIFVARSGQI